MKASIFAASAASLFSTCLAQQFVMYTPGGDDTSVERCDPILAPGQIGQHTHQFFGASGFSPNQTYESLQNSDCTTIADASNNAITFDNSVYWHPSLYVKSNNQTGGWIKVPTNGHKLYYKDAGSQNDIKANPFEFPHGFRMLAGSAMQRAPYEGQQQNITQWICHGENGMNQGTSGGFPTGVTDCPNVDGFNGAIHFPHCWNGEDFNQATPTAHISYPDGDIENGECPSSHPTRLPHIFVENTFNIHAIAGQFEIDSFTLAQGDPTGYGWHFDFYNGWEDGAIPTLLSCPQGEYGNEDVGNCPGFKSRSTPADQCKLPQYYPENVDYPGNNLPGCNPIQTVQPAVDFITAPLGTYGGICTPANGGAGVNAGNGTSGSGSSGSDSGSSGSSTGGSTGGSSGGSSSGSSNGGSSGGSGSGGSGSGSSPTTLVTATRSGSSSPASSGGSGSNNGVDVITVTDQVMVTTTMTVTASPSS